MNDATTPGTQSLLDALEGRYDRWQWTPGLTPEAIGQALGVPLAPGPARVNGRDVLATVASVPTQPHPVRMRWATGGDLELVELAQPPATPSWPAVIEALGPPDVVHPHGAGAFPGSEQRCHLRRGLTVFDGAGLGYQAVWLYPPMTADEYAVRTGAFETPRRAR